MTFSPSYEGFAYALRFFLSYLDSATIWLSKASNSSAPDAGINGEAESSEDTYFRYNDALPSRSDVEFQPYRYGFYRFFAEATGKSSAGDPPMKPKAPETIDEQAEFGYFLDDLKFDIKLSYGLISLLLNVYYCYAYFPQTKTLVFALLDWNSPPHPVTFVDWCASIQFAFYFGTLVGHYYRPELERLILVHGSYVVNGAIWSAWWFLGMQSIKVPGWASIEGKAVLQRDSWSYLYVPILHWWTFLILRRNSLGVYVWDTENRLMHDDKAREVGDTGPDDGPELKASTTGAVLRKPSRLFGMPLYTCYQLWAYLAPVLPLLGWDMVLKPFGPSDLDVWPGTIKVLMVAASATWALKIFYTFLHFQCQCIVWREPFRRGLLINSYGRHLRLGIIYR